MDSNNQIDRAQVKVKLIGQWNGSTISLKKLLGEEASEIPNGSLSQLIIQAT